jgi:hypothetical protein
MAYAGRSSHSPTERVTCPACSIHRVTCPACSIHRRHRRLPIAAGYTMPCTLSATHCRVTVGHVTMVHYGGSECRPRDYGALVRPSRRPSWLWGTTAPSASSRYIRCRSPSPSAPERRPAMGTSWHQSAVRVVYLPSPRPVSTTAAAPYPRVPGPRAIPRPGTAPTP